MDRSRPPDIHAIVRILAACRHLSTDQLRALASFVEAIATSARGQ